MKKVLITLLLSILFWGAAPVAPVFASSGETKQVVSTTGHYNGTYKPRLAYYQLESSGPENLFYYGENWDIPWN